MQIDTIVQVLGFTLVSAALLRATIAVTMFASHHVLNAHRDRKFLSHFRSCAEEQLKTAERGPARSQRFGPQSLKVAGCVVENSKADVYSFYFVSLDGSRLPPYRPGQFLTLQLPDDSSSGAVTRCYSLSAHPSEPQDYYRITVKRQPPSTPGAAAGRVSSYLHDHLREGDVISAFPPAGSFCLDQTSGRPVVLIAGGVGITPIFSMLSWLIATRTDREIWLFYGVRNRSEHIFYDKLNSAVLTRHNVRSMIFYSQPTPDCERGIDYDVEGHVSVDLMKTLLNQRSYEFYVCGPPRFMDTVTAELLQWGVPPSDIASESFGSSSAPRVVPRLQLAPPATVQVSGDGASKKSIEFARSKRVLNWTKQDGTLLELAELAGLRTRSACRAGQCGTCRVKLRSGEVGYIRQPGIELEKNACLPCISYPRSDLVLDL